MRELLPLALLALAPPVAAQTADSLPPGVTPELVARGKVIYNGSAIDLNTGEYRWRIPLGEYAALTAKGVPITGTEQYGGPIVTAGGLVFIAATMDAKFRAFDKTTGKLLWETTLPAAGYATPSTFAVRGKQYVVIAAGGGKLGTKSGDSYVAYALP